MGIAKAGRNRKLEEKIRKQKEDREANAGGADPKAKGGKAPPAAAKKEDAKAPAGKAVKKTPQQIEEEEAEAGGLAPGRGSDPARIEIFWRVSEES